MNQKATTGYIAAVLGTGDGVFIYCLLFVTDRRAFADLCILPIDKQTSVRYNNPTQVTKEDE
ncbi:MAG: hypothetical protein E7438_03175 [Ruminococcaceae bacterium]|nr:hypothetical protein [Oscillospiraceae bacterium]